MKLTKYLFTMIIATFIILQPVQIHSLFNGLTVSTVQASGVLNGLATADKTPVYAASSKDSTVLRSYNNGTRLMYLPYSDEYYQAIVFIDGARHTGYIHHDDVETLDLENQSVLRGISRNEGTTIYELATKTSNKMRTYSAGSNLVYLTFSSEWYQAILFIDGERHTGYIHHDDVENVDRDNQQLYRGLATTDTPIYKKASRQGSSWRTYKEGTILQYLSLSSNWYEAIVFIDGKRKTGYIHKSNVENLDLSTQKDLRGFAQGAVPVYALASKDASTLRTYKDGHLLYYRTFSDHWYEATLIFNGVKKTGYIHKDAVDNLSDAPQETLRGLTLKDPTYIYSRASKSSPSRHAYHQGIIINYKTLTKEWYEASVTKDGKTVSGYIHVSDVETLTSDTQSLEGYADQASTKVFDRASRSGKVLKTYPEGHFIEFETFSSEWYQITLTVSGKQQTGYISKDAIDFEPIKRVHSTTYNYTFDYMVDVQMGRRPQANGTGTVNAVRELVAYYANPSNFRDSDVGFYQFLDLSAPAGLNAKEVNSTILNSRTGTLEGTAQAFIEAGNRYGINEAYLISHALHETGNGASQLAQGVEVNGRTVYNMYGTAAYDGTAVSSGSKYAYEQGWFTPEEAIIGGAQFVAKNYIHQGQNTLYKMRWNPDRPGHHQYATHVAWAQIQTSRIARIYDTLINYVQHFDVPQFGQQPGYQGPTPPANVQSFPNGIIGVTTGTNINFRSTPSISSSTVIDRIGSIGTELKIIGTNNQGWYEAEYNGKTGWLSADYVQLKNLLQVTASVLNVRPNPSTNGDPVGQVSNGTLLRLVLDDEGEPVTHEEWYKVHYNNSEYWISSGPNNNYIALR